MAVGSNRPTTSIRAHEEQDRPLQNKEATNHHERLEAVQQPMEKSSQQS
jgi:hypothetical protein